MKRSFLLLLGLWMVTAGWSQRCASDARLRDQLDNNPTVAAQQEAIERFTQRWLADHDPLASNRTVITIPVVIHIVWQFPEENIANSQIQSQLSVLEEDFRLLNNLGPIPADFLPLAADTEFEFCLARRTPDGEPTDGILRVSTNVNNVGTAQIGGERAIYYSDLGGSDAWDAGSYLNIWVARRQFFPGEASFPADGLANPAEDGIVIAPAFFGTTGTVAPPYHLGRTLTHEIGHYFNLFHLWGPDGEGSCSEDDSVADTPQQSVTYVGECPAGPQFSCGTPDMYMNYMNFTDDACMALFTLGQKMRMLATLSGPRVGLTASDGCLPPSAVFAPETAREINLFPNPVRDRLMIGLPDGLSFPLTLLLTNGNGQILERYHCMRAGNHNLALPAGLQAGFYMIKIEGRSDIFTKKLIIVP